MDIPTSARLHNNDIIVVLESGLEFSFPCAAHPRPIRASPLPQTNNGPILNLVRWEFTDRILTKIYRSAAWFVITEALTKRRSSRLTQREVNPP
jgi:hypothetical protein